MARIFEKIYNCLRDLLSCLMLCYRSNFVPICLKRQANSTSYDTCMLSDIFAENLTVIEIVAGFCKFWGTSIFAFFSFFATNSLYNITDLSNNVLSWCHKTFVVETGALIFVDLCYNNSQISQITILVKSQFLKMIINFFKQNIQQFIRYISLILVY